MKTRPTPTPMIAAALGALFLLAVPLDAAAQHRPQHVTTHRGSGPTHVTVTSNGGRHGHQNGWAERRIAQRAYEDAESRVRAASAEARPYDEAQADIAVARAEGALDDARSALSRSRYRMMYASLADVDRFVVTAERRVADLQDELTDLRRQAQRDVSRLSSARAGYRWSTAAGLMATAESELDDGDRALRYGDYTDARRHYSEAIDAARNAQRAWEVTVASSRRQDNGYHGGCDCHGDDHRGHGDHRRGRSDNGHADRGYGDRDQGHGRQGAATPVAYPMGSRGRR